MATNDRFRSEYIEDCVRRGHHFKVIGSDKTPMKRSLLCTTCTEKSGKDTYVAYGNETLSFGQWRRPVIVDAPPAFDADPS